VSEFDTQDITAAGHGVLRLGDALRARQERPGFVPILISVGIHAAAIAAFVFAGLHASRPSSIAYQAIAIHLVSPPPTVEGPPTEVQTTAPVVAAPREEVKKAPVEKVKPQTQSTDAKVVANPKNVKAATGRHAKPGPVGGEGLNVQQEGVQFPYPDYSDHVIKTLIQYLRWDRPGNWTTKLTFQIKRDGSTCCVEIAKESGNLNFDLAAVAAVENAGKAKAFGPLPKGYESDRLPIIYTYVPNN
jgi:outer membrane biosynthesis protein TonB